MPTVSHAHCQMQNAAAGALLGCAPPTLIATSRPEERSVPRYTWPREAAATAVEDSWLNTWPRGCPKDRSMQAYASASGKGGTRSCRAGAGGQMGFKGARSRGVAVAVGGAARRRNRSNSPQNEHQSRQGGHRCVRS